MSLFVGIAPTATGRYYGTAARAFLHKIAPDLHQTRTELGRLRRSFIEEALPPGADGQVRRVADRFALVAAAGDIASAHGATGWPAWTLPRGCPAVLQ